MSHNKNVATPYAAVYVVLRSDTRIALVLRSKTGWMDGNYCLPSGRVDKGENFSTAAIREAEEEVGAGIKPEDLKLVLTAHRQHPDSEWIDLVFEAQQWQGELHNAEPHVHGEMIWADLNNLPKNITPNSQLYIEEVLKGSTYAESAWKT